MSVDYRINPKFQSLNAIDISRLTNHRTPRADSNNTLYSTSLIYYPNATRYYLLGADFYDEKCHKTHLTAINAVAYAQRGGKNGRAVFQAVPKSASTNAITKGQT